MAKRITKTYDQEFKSQAVKLAQDKQIWRLKEENEVLEEASTFFAASRRKSAKNRDSCSLL